MRLSTASGAVVIIQRFGGALNLNVHFVTRAGQRDRLERLCRYALRPPLGQERLHMTREGRTDLAFYNVTVMRRAEASRLGASGQTTIPR